MLEDNQAAIFLVRNQNVGARTKHIDVRHHWLRQHYPHNFIMMYVETKLNDSDICTKHQSVDLFTQHSNNISMGKLHVRVAWKELEKSFKDGSYMKEK